jgi:hypothetical protein
MPHFVLIPGIASTGKIWLNINQISMATEVENGVRLSLINYGPILISKELWSDILIWAMPSPDRSFRRM